MRHAAWLILLLAITGCGGDGMVTVTGAVTYGGEPVAEGDILFTAAEGVSRPEGGRIEAGRYSFRATPGAKKVEIRATRPIPGTSNAMRGGRPDLKEYIPAEFNSRTTLTATVAATPEPNQIDFNLTAPVEKK